MSINIVEEVQKKMGYEPLQKIDPVTQEPMAIEVFTSPVSALAQAVVPAVTAAIYVRSKLPGEAEHLLNITNPAEYMRALFGDRVLKAVAVIGHYAKIPPAEARLAIEQAAAEAMQVIKGHLQTYSFEQVSSLMTTQRDNILQYLPASLQIGTLLDDNILDDRTNKMGGPISGLMHSIEKVFAGTK